VLESSKVSVHRSKCFSTNETRWDIETCFQFCCGCFTPLIPRFEIWNLKTLKVLFLVNVQMFVCEGNEKNITLFFRARIWIDVVNGAREEGCLMVFCWWCWKGAYLGHVEAMVMRHETWEVLTRAPWGYLMSLISNPSHVKRH